jgi:transcriptional regulator with XRE-family HTH domain
MPKQKTPGEILAGLRQAAGWTRYKLSKACDVDQSQIARIEAGQSCGLETARKLFRALGDEGRAAWLRLLE